jgi:hypothetical protein
MAFQDDWGSHFPDHPSRFGSDVFNAADHHQYHYPDETYDWTGNAGLDDNVAGPFEDDEMLDMEHMLPGEMSGDSEHLQAYLHWANTQPYTPDAVNFPHNVHSYNSAIPPFWVGGRPTYGGLTIPGGYTGPGMGLMSAHGPPVRNDTTRNLQIQERNAQIADFDYWQKNLAGSVDPNTFMHNRIHERAAIWNYAHSGRRAHDLTQLTDMTNHLRGSDGRQLLPHERL